MPALDGLRGFAILLVLFFHLTPVAIPAAGMRYAWGPTAQAVLSGSSFAWCGVDLFFVLSGFLITGILHDTRDGPHYFRNFFARRTLRVFPLYYAVLAGVLVAALLSFRGIRPVDPAAFWRGQAYLWTYTTNFGNALHGWSFASVSNLDLAHFWSLAVEEQFYLVWPFVIFSLTRGRAIGVCAALVVAAPLLRAGMLLAGFSPLAIYTFTPARMDALVGGALLALWLRHTRLPYRTLLRRAVFTAVPASAALAVIVWSNGPKADSPVMQTAGFSLLALVSGGLLVAALGHRTESPVARLMEARPLRFLGRYSYGIYIFHFLLLTLFLRHLGPPKWERVLGSYGRACVAAAVTAGLGSILLAVVSFHLFERPFLGLKRYFDYSKHPRERAEATRTVPAAEPQLAASAV